jgi:hypothetical protein
VWRRGVDEIIINPSSKTPVCAQVHATGRKWGRARAPVLGFRHFLRPREAASRFLVRGNFLGSASSDGKKQLQFQLVQKKGSMNSVNFLLSSQFLSLALVRQSHLQHDRRFFLHTSASTAPNRRYKSHSGPSKDSRGSS